MRRLAQTFGLIVVLLGLGSGPTSTPCDIQLKPLRPLGCQNGYPACYCSDPYDWDTCRWIWICP